MLQKVQVLGFTVRVSSVCRGGQKAGWFRGYHLPHVFPLPLLHWQQSVYGEKTFRIKKVLFWCDNQSVVHIVNRQSAKSAWVMGLVRVFVLQRLRFNILFHEVHGSGMEMVLPMVYLNFRRTDSGNPPHFPSGIYRLCLNNCRILAHDSCSNSQGFSCLTDSEDL